MLEYIKELIPLDTERDNHLAIRKIYHTLEYYRILKDYDSIDEYIRVFLFNQLSLTLHVSVLIATMSIKSNLKSRMALYKNAQRLAISKCKSKNLSPDKIQIEVDSLLLGLL